MSELTKKELRENYKNRVLVGGVYCIKCEENGRAWVKSTKDLMGQKNKFEFSIMTNSCLDPTMTSEWNQYGAKSFSFVVLEELQKGDIQTEAEYKSDIVTLYEMWIEKLKDK